ncbi:putative damage-inducible protein DinB [Sporosarcina luteola]|nr:putative damage-inducible protein DinB [Sporosarcina luteola]
MQINDKEREELLNELNDLSDEEINRKPSDNEWSIQQILEHLYLMEGGITQTIAHQLATGEEKKVADKPIELSVNRSTKVQAPPFAVPTEDFRSLAELQTKLLQSHEALRKFVHQSRAADLEKKAYPHPVFGDLNLKQWIPFIAYHEMRHTEQLKEVKDKLGLTHS